MIRRVTIEKLAPTGEGIARTRDDTGFVDGALPGEEVEALVEEVRSKFWRGRVSAVLSASSERRTGPHTAGCGGCDWAHWEVAAARRAKRELFLETMERIGKLPREIFGELPVAPSPPGYRLRNRFRVTRAAGGVEIGCFARRTHRIEPVRDCEAVTPETLAILPRVEEAIAASRASVAELVTLENLDGSRRVAGLTLDGGAEDADLSALERGLGGLFQGLRIEAEDRALLGQTGEPLLRLRVAGRDFRLGVDTFFQANRYLAETLYGDVREVAKRVAPGDSLDAYGGVGFFAGALLEAGHSVVTVEGHRAAVEAASRTRELWGAADRWRITRASVRDWLGRSGSRFALIVADPPRAGLGAALARALATRATKRFLYVSCEPATLARDLPFLLAEGFELEEARLYDLFAFTHRVEAVIALARNG